MAHDVKFSIPERALGRADATFRVKKNGRMLGTLTVSSGSVVWFPKNVGYGYKATWGEFDRFMKKQAKRAEKR